MTLLPDITVILPTTGPDRVVERAVETLRNQDRLTMEIVVLHRPGSPVMPERYLERLSLRHQLLFAASQLSRGQSLNQAVEAGTAKYFYIADGSEALPHNYLAAAVTVLDTDPSCGYAASPGISDSGEGGDLVAALLASPWALAGLVFRRASWELSSRFDETLPELLEWELLISLEERGESGVMVNHQGPGPSRYHGDDLGLRAALRPERYLESMRRIFGRHHVTFESRAADTLVSQERVANRLWLRERELVAKRDHARAVLATDGTELARLRSELQTYRRSTLEWGDLRRTTPLSRTWGFDRGRPVDRYYIEGFLERQRADIRGDVLEVLDANLTMRFGGDQVRRSDVLDIDPGNHLATVVADLRVASDLPMAQYDCFILTQTLHLIDDMRAAVANAHRVLKDGGVLLVTLPAVSMVERGSGDRWRMTERGARDLFESVFGESQVSIESHGNVLAAAAFLYGLSCDELERSELDENDEFYPVVVTVRAVKLVAAPAVVPVARRNAAAVVLYHRIADLANDPYQMAVSPATFRRHVERLCEQCHVMPLSALAGALQSGDLPDRAVALTFDDGYVDNLEVAVPILREFGLPATFFLTTETPRRRREFWWDLLQRVFQGGDEIPPVLTVRVAGELRLLPAGSVEARRDAHDQLYAVLKTSLPAVRDDILTQVRSQTGIAGVEGERPVDEDETKSLAAVPGMEIGAHTVHHVSLPSLAGEALFREVSECRTSLQHLTSHSVTSFAYPFGDLSPASVEMVRSAGYEVAVTCEPRRLRRHEHTLRVPRVQAPNADAEQLMRLLWSRD